MMNCWLLLVITCPLLLAIVIDRSYHVGILWVEMLKAQWLTQLVHDWWLEFGCLDAVLHSRIVPDAR